MTILIPPYFQLHKVKPIDLYDVYIKGKQCTKRKDITEQQFNAEFTKKRTSRQLL